jgi:copper(I)-binding protein
MQRFNWRRWLVALPAILALAVSIQAREVSSPLLVTGAWARATNAGMPMGVVYLTIRNVGSREDTLESAATPVATRVEFHRTVIDHGVARMRPADDLRISSGATLEAGPGGLHLMLVDLKAPLAAGTTVPLTLRFKLAGELTVPVSVRTE